LVAKANKKEATSSFLLKVYSIVDSEDIDLASWVPDGLSFIVKVM
jgi:hypothetical protein